LRPSHASPGLAVRLVTLTWALVAVVACGEEPPEPRSSSRAARPSAEPASPTYPTTADELVELFIAEVARRDPSVEVRRLGDMRVQAYRVGEDDPAGEMTLENAWGECRPSPRECQSVVETYASVFLQTEPDPVRIEHVRLVLFGRDVMTRQGSGALAWAEPFAGDFMSAYVLDSPDAILTLRPEQLSELELPAPALRARALTNMRRAFGPLRHGVFSPDGSIHMIETNGNGVASDSYNAARLLLPDLWRPLREVVRGELVAAAPARDIAMFTGTEEPRGIEGLRYLAREMFHGEPHPVSPQLVRWSENGWVAIP